MTVPLAFVTGAFQDNEAEPVVAPATGVEPLPEELGVVLVVPLEPLEPDAVVPVDFNDVLAVVGAVAVDAELAVVGAVEVDEELVVVGAVEVDELELAFVAEVVDAVAEAAELITLESEPPQAARVAVQIANAASVGIGNLVCRVRMARY